MKDKRLNNHKQQVKIGKYHNLSLVGKGNGGRVFKAYDPDLERNVALKLLDKHEGIAGERRQAMLREIKLQAGLNLPGMVRVFDYGEFDGNLYYTMEFINGLTLDQYCLRKQISVRDKLLLIAEVIATVAKLHKRNIIHRDIKPSNIMIDEHGIVKLLDLGVALSLGDPAQFRGDFSLCGSPGYIAPELFTGEHDQVTTAIDIYSLGVMAYELLSHRLPYDFEFLSREEVGTIINTEPPRPLKLPKNEHIPNRIKNIIEQAMSIDPKLRPNAHTFSQTIKDAYGLSGDQQSTFWKYFAILCGGGIAAGIMAGIIYYIPTIKSRIPQPFMTKDLEQHKVKAMPQNRFSTLDKLISKRAEVKSTAKATTTTKFTQLRLPPIWQVLAKERFKALRVAQMDAHRALAERIYGLQLESGSLFYDYMLNSDRIKTNMDHLLKGATAIGEPKYTKYGIVTVTYAVKLREVIKLVKINVSNNNSSITTANDYYDKIIEAQGYGALPDTKGQTLLYAKRAAELDAYRQLAERLVGIKINSQTTVADLCYKSYKVQSRVIAFLKGIKPVSIKYNSDNSCTVKMQLKIKKSVKTIESLILTYNKDQKQDIDKHGMAVQDKLFTVVGHGTYEPDSTRETTNHPKGYDQIKIIIQQVIYHKVITD